MVSNPLCAPFETQIEKEKRKKHFALYSMIFERNRF